MITVNVSSLAGSTTAYQRPQGDHIRDLKVQMAQDRGLPSSRVKLFKDFEVQKNNVALEELAKDGIVELSTMSMYERISAGAVESLSNNEVDMGMWDAAASEVVGKLREAAVEQGQIIWIDLHNTSSRSRPVVCAFFSRDMPGSGPLQIEYRGRAGKSWDELYAWAAELAAGKEVISISGASAQGLGDRNNKYMCVFWYSGEVCPTAIVEHVRSAAGTWNGAADGILLKLHDKGVQRGQLLGIDAHNDGPYADAVFTAHFSSSLEGYGRLALYYHCFANQTAEWSTIQDRIAKENAGKELVSLTGSSNEDRIVGYAFWHVPIDPLEFCVVETPAGNWNAAAEALAAKLSELQVQFSQIVTIDAHNKGFDQSCVLSAHYRTVDDPINEGPLQLAWEIRESKDSKWEQLRQWANTVSIGKEVWAITATSGTLADNTHGLTMMVFHRCPAQEPLPDSMPVEFVASAGQSWDGAANSLVTKLQQANVDRGHIINISACNLNPDAPAEFQCHFSRARVAGQKGKLAYDRFNYNASFNAMHHMVGVKASGKDIISITGSSNENGRAVLYVFHWEANKS